jgi:hypothetical protein
MYLRTIRLFLLFEGATFVARGVHKLRHPR